MQRLGWVRKQVHVEVAVQGKAEKKRRWLYCRPPTEEELELEARQVELSNAVEAEKRTNVTSKKGHAPVLSEKPVMEKTTAPQE